MASNVVSVVVRADSSQLTSAFDKTASSAERFKAKIGLVGQAVVAALAFKAVNAAKDFAVDSIRAFSDLNESLNALEVTYGEHADGIKKLGEESAQSLGISNSEFNQFAVSISNFAKEIAGDSGDVVGVVETLTGRITDFASVMNIDIADAQEKFQSGLAGQSRPLREFGIDVSDARVKAFALANEIGEVGREMTEGEKVQARFGAIMEQTTNTAGDFRNTADELANSERIVNAEMENSKALFGEIIAPMKEATIEMQGGLVNSLNDAAIQLGFLTGALSDGEAALLSFKNQTGETADSAEDVIEGVILSWQSWTHEIDVWADTLFGGTRQIDAMSDGLRTLIDEQKLTTDGITELKDELLVLLHSGKLTEEEFHALSKTLDDEFGRSMAEARGEMQTTLPVQRQLSGAFEDTAAAIDEVIAANQRAASPLLQALEAARKLTEAQNAYNQAVKEFGPESAQATDAAGKQIEAQLGLDAALSKITEEAGPNWRAEFRRVASDAGVASESIDQMIRDVERADGLSATVEVSAHVQAPTVRFTDTGGGTVTPVVVDRRIYAQHGGIARSQNGGVPLTAAEAGADEALIPMNHEGVGILAAALQQALSSMNGGGSGLHFHGPVYGLEDFERKLQEVIVRARRKGMKI